MAISVFDLFKIGVGPSSSHTVGPMVAARRFSLALEDQQFTESTARLQVELLGSLGATGKGRGSDTAVLLGLEGEHPTTNRMTHASPFLSTQAPHYYNNAQTQHEYRSVDAGK